MADIELVIKIPEGLKNDFESEQWTALSCMEMKNALEKATLLPKGHGRLKDVDKLETHDEYDGQGFTKSVYQDDIDNLPTIIEADKAESEDERKQVRR